MFAVSSGASAVNDRTGTSGNISTFQLLFCPAKNIAKIKKGTKLTCIKIHETRHLAVFYLSGTVS